MSIIDVDKVINGSPIKRINNAYNTMKENYNENTALDFFNVYSKEPLSAVLETSESILSEPRHGAEFITKLSCPDICSFESARDIYDFVNDYYKEHVDQMSDTQKEIYDKQIRHIQESLSDVYNTTLYSDYIKENIDPSFESKLSEILYEMKENKHENKNYSEEIVSLFEDVNPLVYFTFSPYTTQCMKECGEDSSSLTEAAREYLEDMWNVDNKKYLFESIICCKKLKHDPAYMEAVSYIPKFDRGAFEYLMEATLEDAIDTFTTKATVKPEQVIHVTSESAVNSIFDEIERGDILHNDDQKIKSFNESMKLTAYEAVLDILHTEYEMSENTSDIAYGYDFVTENSTIEEAYKQIHDLCESVDIPVIESDDDVSDDDIDSMNSSINDEKPEVTPEKKSPAPNAPVEPSAPVIKDKKLTKLQDKEARKLAKQQKKEEKGLRRKMRFKAATSAPRNAVKRVEQQVNAFDEMDDNRRKAYMTKPGFRKKWFRNLKLAILYGTAASYKIAMLPIVAMCRHFSKKKDRRMQNELVREIDTEIKVVDEKINDANAAGDQKQKYQLMRTKAQLEAERTRVATNSKYI